MTARVRCDRVHSAHRGRRVELKGCRPTGPRSGDGIGPPPFTSSTKGYDQVMGVLLALLVIILIVAGVGFAVHVLWIVAIVLFIAWLIGLVLGVGRKSRS